MCRTLIKSRLMMVVVVLILMPKLKTASYYVSKVNKEGLLIQDYFVKSNTKIIPN